MTTLTASEARKRLYNLNPQPLGCWISFAKTRIKTLLLSKTSSAISPVPIHGESTFNTALSIRFWGISRP